MHTAEIWISLRNLGSNCYVTRTQMCMKWIYLWSITNASPEIWITSDAEQKKHVFFYKKKNIKKKNIVQKKLVFNVFISIFYNLKKGKYISILWSAYSVIHILYCIIQAVQHYMNCIYIDSDSNNFIIVIIIIIFKKGWQCKAGRERLTPYQSKDPNPITPTHRMKEEKGKTSGDKKWGSS